MARIISDDEMKKMIEAEKAGRPISPCYVCGKEAGLTPLKSMGGQDLCRQCWKALS